MRKVAGLLGGGGGGGSQEEDMVVTRGARRDAQSRLGGYLAGGHDNMD